MEHNLLQSFFIFNSYFITVFGFIVNYYTENLPSFLVSVFHYGKSNSAVKSNFFDFQVPKRWFKHFYIFATLWAALFFFLTSFYYFHIIDKIPVTVSSLISWFSTKDVKATVSPAATLLALFLMVLQVLKRYYETHYVSVFSNSKMHISHYILGHLHYFGTVMAIVINSPGFSHSDDIGETVRISDISLTMCLASLFFIWAWWNQLKSATILANLRKDKKGKVVTESHQIPYGGLFAYVSGAHNLCEVLMYLSLSVILYENSTFHSVTNWVICNQIETALLSHWWYQKTFENYPKSRKAIFPFIL